MIKKQQKWIALLVTLTFIWLLQVSTMPLAAANTAEQASFASFEQGPDFIEAVKHKAAPPPKKSILPYVLIGVGVVAVAAVLFLVVFKTKYKYDIRGTWQYYYKWDDLSTETGPITITFSGSQSSGQLVFDVQEDNQQGTYTITKENVSFVIDSNHKPWNHTGSFESENKMSGTFTFPYGVGTGTWYATRSQD
ncbi:MAG: hypothetical protein WCL37_03765 [Chrysiogenales bacterium]